MIDGGFFRVAARKAKIRYTPDFIRRVFENLSIDRRRAFSSTLLRLCALSRTPKPPRIRFDSDFCRLGPMAKGSRQEGFDCRQAGRAEVSRLQTEENSSNRVAALTDADFKPDFEQKGVDMRIGLDIAAYSALKCVDRIGLVTADTDCVPAMKLARKSGVQVVLFALPGGVTPSELAQHTDYVRAVAWPP